MGDRNRARQTIDPSSDIGVIRGEPRFEDLARHAVDRVSRHRSGVHVQPYTRTPSEHRGLPQLSERPSRRLLLGNPRTSVSEAGPQPPNTGGYAYRLGVAGVCQTNGG